MRVNRAYVNRADTAVQIYRAIEDSGMTQRQVADILEVTPTDICRWATGRHLPDVEAMTMLADALGVTIDSLIVRRKKK